MGMPTVSAVYTDGATAAVTRGVGDAHADTSAEHGVVVGTAAAVGIPGAVAVRTVGLEVDEAVEAGEVEAILLGPGMVMTSSISRGIRECVSAIHVGRTGTRCCP